MKYLTEQALHNFIFQALTEDVGDGDHTTLATIEKGKTGLGELLVKDEGVLAGAKLAQKIFNFIDPETEIHFHKKDGDRIIKGDKVLTISGKIHTILTGERLVLNCMQRMSGIATQTAHLNSLISHTSAKLLDTRKTTPNFRIPEKWAVSIGGGVNHRFGLFDMILLKDNHIDYAGGVSKAIESAKKYIENTGKSLKIEVETRSIQEVEEAVKTGGIHRIMLDNMSLATMEKAVKYINKQYETEASGGITEDTIKEVAETGVDYISVGALTHSIKSLDLSLKAKIV